jgi:hypothetical protein
LRLSLSLSAVEQRRLSLLLDLCLLDVASLHFAPSLLASAALHLLLPSVKHAALAERTVRPSTPRYTIPNFAGQPIGI